MKKFVCVLNACVLAVVFFIAAAYVSAQDAVEPGGPRVEITKITANFYLLVCTTNFTSNCVAVVRNEGILLVDAGMEPTADALVAELKKLSDKPVKYLIHTHGHQDHTGANAILGKDATIIAHQDFETGYKTGYGLLIDLPQEAYPDKTFIDDYSIEFGGEKIELKRMTGGHALDDAIVYFTDSGIVCTGGLYSTGAFPYLDLRAGGDIKKLTRTIFKLLDVFPEDTKYVPSHGAVSTREELMDFYEMLIETTAIIQRGIDDGKDVETMQADDVLNGWESWAGGFISKNLWIETVANSLTGSIEPVRKLILEPLYYTLKKKDAAAAIEQYYMLKKSHPDDYDYGEANLNAIGYYLMGKERFDDAIEILKLNVAIFPESANPYDSLGEAYMRKGDTELAIKSYEKALTINPEMPSAIQALKQLKGE